ncbi:MAG TPA: c-type cytochrome, methanol metabolism-related [Kiloniellales bacterium]|jgi:methanol metabolism-related c-type cytochrome|nr:c-type cytochrome, methanol metabolism-related [Kiloniellales bacterium]
MNFSLRFLHRTAALLLGAALLTGAAGELAAQEEGVTRGEDGKSYTEEGTPTYHVGEDGTVDWYIYQGFRRYHSECHVCHGPDGMGSTFAPALANSLKRLDYYEFMDIVVNGRGSGNSVMPSFGDNPNVMCYIDDIYIYLKARSDDAIPRGRPAKREDKPDAATEAEDACFGT